MITLILNIKKQVDESKAQGFLSLDPDVLSAFEIGYQTILNEGLKANSPIPSDAPKSRGRPRQSPPKNLLDRLQSHISDSFSRERSVLLKLAITFLEIEEVRLLCGLFGERSRSRDYATKSSEPVKSNSASLSISNWIKISVKALRSGIIF
jgi:hypothetical protein